MSQPSSIPSGPPEPRSIRLDSLRAFHKSVCDALAASAPKAGPPSELAASGMSLQCEQCGLQVSGAEWGAVLQTEDHSVLGDPRLSRFHQGYCGRKDCQSYYYRVTFSEVPGVDWGQILAQVGRDVPQPEASIPAAPAFQFGAGSRRQMAIRLGIGAAVIGILLLARRLWTGGSIPLVKPARKFTVDPSSLPPPQPGK